MSLAPALTAFACLMGAAGVALAARAAHGGGDSALMSAALFLLIHAAAIPALATGIQGWRSLTLLGVVVLAVGTCLFSGDIALRSLAGVKLFLYAAPIGGTAMIVGWLLAGAGSLAASWRGGIGG